MLDVVAQLPLRRSYIILHIHDDEYAAHELFEVIDTVLYVEVDLVAILKRGAIGSGASGSSKRW